jgi:NADH dehydrogenase (ubiquinone) Fe-S protein 4
MTMKAALPPHPVYEPANRAEIAVLSYQPEEQRSRTVVIGPRPRTTLQSGRRKARQWQITWKAQERWSNPLMGWTSTADPMSNLRLYFDSSEDAMRFAEKQGWKFEVMPEYAPEDKWGEVQYAHNFLPVSTENALKRQGLNNKIFENPGLGKSNWFMPLKYHGDGVVQQHGPKSDSK